MALLDRHALVIGATGSGKTRLSLHLLTERLRAGGSALVLDFKRDTVRQALPVRGAGRHGAKPGHARVAGEDAGQGVPGWNPFAGEPGELRQRVRQFVGLVRASADVAGTRMWDLLTNAATVIAGQGLSIVELLRFLQSPDYMAGLLRPGAADARLGGVRGSAPVLRPGVCRTVQGGARQLRRPRAQQDPRPCGHPLPENHDERRPRHARPAWPVAAPAPGRGASGRVRPRPRRGAPAVGDARPHPLQPLGAQAGEGGGDADARRTGLAGAVSGGSGQRTSWRRARQQGLHLLAAGQHLEQISDELRKLLLSSCALRVFFRLGPDDALRAGKWLATGGGSQPLRVALGVEKNGAYEAWRHDILDPWGQPVRLNAGDWETFQSVQATCWESMSEEHRRVPALRLLLERQGVTRLYVRAADTNAVCELGAYVMGMPANAFGIQGPSPLALLVRFPRPKVSIMGTRSEAERAGLIAQALMQMPPQEAVVITDTGEKAQVKTVAVHFPDTLPPVGLYLNRQAQSQEEMQATQQGRRAGIEALSQGSPVTRVEAALQAPRTPVQPPPLRKTASVRTPRTEGPGRAKTDEAANELKAAIAAAQQQEGVAHSPATKAAHSQGAKVAQSPAAKATQSPAAKAAQSQGAKATQSPAAEAGGMEAVREAAAEPPAARVPRPEVEDDGTI